MRSSEQLRSVATAVVERFGSLDLVIHAVGAVPGAEQTAKIDVVRALVPPLDGIDVHRILLCSSSTAITDLASL